MNCAINALASRIHNHGDHHRSWTFWDCGDVRCGVVWAADVGDQDHLTDASFLHCHIYMMLEICYRSNVERCDVLEVINHYLHPGRFGFEALRGE